jgi:hypothetical protein
MDLTSAVVLTLTRRVQSTRRNTQHSQRGLGTSGTGVCVCQMPEAVRGMGRRRENWVEVERSKCSTDCRRHDRCLQPPATQGINLPGQNTAACSIPAISRGDPASPLSQPKVGQHPPRSFSAESPRGPLRPARTPSSQPAPWDFHTNRASDSRETRPRHRQRLAPTAWTARPAPPPRTSISTQRSRMTDAHYGGRGAGSHKKAAASW